MLIQEFSVYQHLFLFRTPVDVAKYGVSSQLQNIGNVENKGFELALGVTPIRERQLTWNIQGNLAYNKNEITNLGNHQELNTNNYSILRKHVLIQS